MFAKSNIESTDGLNIVSKSRRGRPPKAVAKNVTTIYEQVSRNIWWRYIYKFDRSVGVLSSVSLEMDLVSPANIPPISRCRFNELRTTHLYVIHSICFLSPPLPLLRFYFRFPRLWVFFLSHVFVSFTVSVET